MKYCDDLPGQIKLSWKTIKVIYYRAGRQDSRLFMEGAGGGLRVDLRMCEFEYPALCYD